MDGFQLFPMISPAQVVKYPESKRGFEIQFKVLANLCRGGKKTKTPKPRYTHVTRGLKTADGLKPIVPIENPVGPIAFDIESTGVDPRKCRTRCSGFTDKVGQCVTVDNVEAISKKFWTENEFIAHEAKFEGQWMREQFGIDPKIISDTKMAHSLLHEGEIHSLDQVSKVYTSIGGFKNESVEWLMKNNNDWSSMPQKMIVGRNFGDVDATLRLHKMFEHELKKQDLWWLYQNVSVPMARMCGLMEQRGIYVNQVKLAKLKASEQKIADEQKSFICKTAKIEDLNFRSSDQMIDFLFERMQLTSVWKTKAKAKSTEIDAMKYIKATQVLTSEEHAILDACIAGKKALYNVSKIVEVEKQIREDGTVSSNINPSWAATGRLTSSSPNLQNLPRDKLIKSCMESRWDDGMILRADYAQVEMRIIAGLSGCADLLRGYAEGRDMHQETADENDLDRPDGKTVNFASNYGVGAGTLRKDLLSTFEECREFLNRMSSKWWEIPMWRRKMARVARKQGYIRNFMGRKRRLYNINSEDDSLRQAEERIAGNFPIQSLAGDTINYCMPRLEEDMRAHKLDSLIIFQVHDEIVLDYCPSDDLETLERLIQKWMVDEMMARFNHYTVPLGIDIEKGESWGGKDI